MDVADSEENVKAFGRPPSSAAECLSTTTVCGLTENGTHVLVRYAMSGCERGELSLAEETIKHLRAGMLC